MTIGTNTSTTQAPAQGVRPNAPRQPERPTYDYSGPAVFNPKLADAIATNPGAYTLGQAPLLRVINDPAIRQKLKLPQKPTNGQIVSAALTLVFDSAPNVLNQYNKVDPYKTAKAATRAKTIGLIDLLPLAKDPEGTLKPYFAAETTAAAGTEAAKKAIPTPTPLEGLNGPNLDNVQNVAAVTGIQSGWALKIANRIGATQVTQDEINGEQQLLSRTEEVIA